MQHANSVAQSAKNTTKDRHVATLAQVTRKVVSPLKLLQCYTAVKTRDPRVLGPQIPSPHIPGSSVDSFPSLTIIGHSLEFNVVVEINPQ